MIGRTRFWAGPGAEHEAWLDNGEDTEMALEKQLLVSARLRSNDRGRPNDRDPINTRFAPCGVFGIILVYFNIKTISSKLSKKIQEVHTSCISPQKAQSNRKQFTIKVRYCYLLNIYVKWAFCKMLYYKKSVLHSLGCSETSTCTIFYSLFWCPQNENAPSSIRML